MYYFSTVRRIEPIVQGRLSPQRQWRKLPPPLPFPLLPLSLPSPFPPFPPIPLSPPRGLEQSPQYRGTGVLPPENGNWYRIWCILAHFCFKTAAIQCFNFCKQKLNKFSPPPFRALPPENGNWNRIWCILAHFCFITTGIHCFTFCEQKLN